jgi:hypothetical protein
MFPPKARTRWVLYAVAGLLVASAVVAAALAVRKPPPGGTGGADKEQASVDRNEKGDPPGDSKAGDRKSDKRKDEKAQDQATGKPAEPTPVVSTTAVELWEAYGRNGLAADAEYKGRHVRISGGVRLIQQDEKGRYFVGFSIVEPAVLTAAQYNRLSPKERKWYDEGYPPNVVCYLAPSHSGDFASVKVGQAITIIGKVVGRKQGDVWMGYLVEVEDGRLAK